MTSVETILRRLAGDEEADRIMDRAAQAAMEHHAEAVRKWEKVFKAARSGKLRLRLPPNA